MRNSPLDGTSLERSQERPTSCPEGADYWFGRASNAVRSSNSGAFAPLFWSSVSFDSFTKPRVTTYIATKIADRIVVEIRSGFIFRCCFTVTGKVGWWDKPR